MRDGADRAAVDRTEEPPDGQAQEDSRAVEQPVGQPWDRRRDGRVLVVLLLVVWAVYLATASYSIVQVNDNRATVASAWSLATRGTLALPGEWEGELRWEVEGQDGRLYTDRFPGVILTTVPAYVVADLVGAADEPSVPLFLNFVPAGFTAATLAALTVGTMYAVFRQLVDRRPALIAALLLAFGSAVWSVNANAVWTHTTTSLALAFGMLAVARGRHGWGGTALALSILARPQTAVVAAVIGLWQGFASRSIRPVAAVGVTSALGLAAVSVYSHVYFGTFLPISGYGEGKVASVVDQPGSQFLENVAYTLVQRERGVLFYTPLLLLLLPFVHRGWRAAPTWVRSSAVAGLLYLIVQLRANTWDGGFGYFGSRLTIETLVLSAPLLLCVWWAIIRHDRLLRVIFWILASASIAIHTVGGVWYSAPPEEAARFLESVEERCLSDDAPPECTDQGFVTQDDGSGD